MQNKPSQKQNIKENKPKRKYLFKALFIIGLSIVGVSIGLFGGLYFTGNLDDLDSIYESIPSIPFLASDKETTTIVSLEPFLVNLKPVDNRRPYANITLMLDVDNDYSEMIQETKIPLVRDRIITHLSTHTPDTLTGRNETDKNMSFKKELVALLNSELENDPIHDVLITDLIIQ